jgi:hypothetical protein
VIVLIDGPSQVMPLTLTMDRQEELVQMPFIASGSAAQDRRHHPGRGDPQDAVPSEARGRPAAACPCPCAPNHVRLGCLSRRRGASARWRRARRGGGSHPVERGEFPLQSAVEQRGLSRPCAPALRRAAGRAGGRGRCAGWPARAWGAAGAVPVGGARVKSGFVFPIRHGARPLPDA